MLKGACEQLALAVVGGRVDSPSKWEKPRATKKPT